jgi:hypothetical protein
LVAVPVFTSIAQVCPLASAGRKPTTSINPKAANAHFDE